jgi:hypothetical protein
MEHDDNISQFYRRLLRWGNLIPKTLLTPTALKSRLGIGYHQSLRRPALKTASFR